MKEPIYDFRITKYNRALLPSRFLAFMEDGVSNASDWIERSGRSLGHPAWGFFYHLLLCHLSPGGPNTIIETGTNLGSTAILAAQAILDSGRPGVVHTVEIDEEIRESALDRFLLAGVDGVVRSHLGDSLATLAGLLPDIAPIRVALLDGNHFHDHVVAEFRLVEPYLESDGIVVFDNTFLIGEGREDPRVNGALRTIMSKYGGSLVNLPYCSWYTPGLAIWQRQAFENMMPPSADAFDSEI